jgi:single-strand DNA-binding protein
MYINSFVVSGNVGKGGATLREAGDTKVLSFSLANTSPFGQKITTWYNVSLFGRQAEGIAPYVTQGSQVVVVGELTNRPYDDKEGNKRLSLDIRASNVQLASRRESEETNETTEGEDSTTLF